MIVENRDDLYRFQGKKVIIITTEGTEIKGTLLSITSEEVDFRSNGCRLIINTEKGQKKLFITQCRTIDEEKGAALDNDVQH